MQPRFIGAAFFLGFLFALTEETQGSSISADAQWTLKTEQSAIDRRNLGDERENTGQNGSNDGGSLGIVDERGRLHQNKEADNSGLEKRRGDRVIRNERNYTDGEEDDNMDEDEGAEFMDDNCTHPRQPFPWYNNSCDLIHAECRGKSELIDYLAFVLCDLPKAQVPIYAQCLCFTIIMSACM